MLAAALSQHQRKAVRVLSFQPGNPQEQRVCRQAAARVPGGAEVMPVRSIAELTVAVAGASFVLTQRYHGAVLALALGIPFQVASQQPTDKLAALAESRANNWPLLLTAGDKLLEDSFDICKILKL